MKTQTEPTHEDLLKLLNRFMNLEKAIKGECTHEEREQLQKEWDEHCEVVKEALE